MKWNTFSCFSPPHRHRSSDRFVNLKNYSFAHTSWGVGRKFQVFRTLFFFSLSLSLSLEGDEKIEFQVYCTREERKKICSSSCHPDLTSGVARQDEFLLESRARERSTQETDARVWRDFGALSDYGKIRNNGKEISSDSPKGLGNSPKKARKNLVPRPLFSSSSATHLIFFFCSGVSSTNSLYLHAYIFGHRRKEPTKTDHWIRTLRWSSWNSTERDIKNEHVGDFNEL